MAKPLIISDLRGGMSDEHPAKLAPNQVAYAQNIDYWDGWLGGRRNGTTLFTGTGLNTAAHMHRHQPTSDVADDRLWVMYVGGPVFFNYYNTAGTGVSPTVTPGDTLTTTNASFASLHGKLFIACKSSATRLHVFDGTVLRRAGLEGYAGGLTLANSGSGSYSTTRYFRMRWVVEAGGVVTLRSEPSPSTTITPSGSGTGVTVTRPPLLGEGETHWEVEESLDEGNWYRIARVAVGTTTYADTLSAANVALDGVLSEDIGDYLLLPSARWLTVDEDRLVYAGNFDDAALDARVGWTPLGSDIGSGNDERAPLDVGSYVDVDGRNGGKVTGIRAFDRKVMVFKDTSINTLIRSGSRTRAYVLGPAVSRSHGALPYSIAEGLDATGSACLYFADTKQGIMRYGANGLEALTPQMLGEWGDLYQGGSGKVVEGVYHAEKGQYWLNVTTGSANYPNSRWVYDRFTGGVTIHTTATMVTAMAMWNGKPHTAATYVIARCDDETATDDFGIGGFRAFIRTKAYQAGSLLLKTATTMAAVEATPHYNVVLTLKMIRDYGVETRSVQVPLTATMVETRGAVPSIIRLVDNAYISEALAIQFELGDAEEVSVEPWQLHQLVLGVKGEGVAA